MHLKNLFRFIAAILITVYFLTSCDNSTQPEEIKPGRRDYVWEVDSIDVPYFFLTDISGTSPNDVWAVGPGGDLDKTIWHYDGKKWSTDGISRNVSPDAVFVIDNVVWIAGSEGVIWKREHGSWNFSAKLELDGFKRIGLASIYGSSKNDIYAVGAAVAIGQHRYQYVVVAHYDGTKWERIDTHGERCSCSQLYKDPKSDKYYFAGSTNELRVQDTSKLYMLQNDKLTTVYKSTTETIGVSRVGDELLFQVGNKVAYLSNNKLVTLLEINDANYRGGFEGRSRKDLFFSMYDGIMHYNGNNLEYIYKFPQGINISLGLSVIFEKEYFQIESSHNYILHGKLK